MSSQRKRECTTQHESNVIPAKAGTFVRLTETQLSAHVNLLEVPAFAGMTVPCPVVE